MDFIKSHLTIAVIAGIFTYKLISSYLEYLIYPIIDILLNKNSFEKISLYLDKDLNQKLITPVDLTGTIKIKISFGYVIRETIIWLIAMLILFGIVYLTN